ncbi:PREDICTED: mucin-20-like [Elephantulus edwardii]|uniref:mucin-20-like n=1 Tax=Elephantulus edwardii TaxID=28737 RepID=UPI0003F0ED51|nr:PREDICTED: mucin-20-like [Elephantulus edwardii]
MAISEMATAVTGSKLTKFIFDSLCTDESTEEVKMVTADISVLAHTSAEAESLTSESRASSDITTSSALEPGSMDPFKVWEAYTITGVEVTNSSVTETDTSATVPGPSGTNHSPTRGVAALPTPEISASPDSMESAHITDTTASNETMSTFSTTESGTPGTTGDVLLTTKDTTDTETPVRSGTPGTTGDVPLITKDMTDRETPIKASTHNSPLVPVSSTQSWEETLSFYVGTSSHIEVSETVTVSTEAESTMSKVPAPLTFSATMNSPSEVVTIKNSTSSETFTTDSATGRTFSTSRDPVPSVHLITANSSQRANITMSKTTASSGPLMSTSTTRRKPPTAVPSTAQTQLTTRGAADEDGGFLLLRLSVVSPEDLTDPRVTERLIRQIRHTLRAHMLPIPVSLLRVSMS